MAAGVKITNREAEEAAAKMVERYRPEPWFESVELMIQGGRWTLILYVTRRPKGYKFPKRWYGIWVDVRVREGGSPWQRPST